MWPSPGLVAWLIAHGADVNFRADLDEYPFPVTVLWLCASNNRLAMAACMLEHGADPNRTEPEVEPDDMCSSDRTAFTNRWLTAIWTWSGCCWPTG